MLRFSIVVPTYNSEKYIVELLESLVNQSYTKQNFEVVFVDDCSVDNTSNIIESYKEKLNIKFKVLKENSGGPGKPRNIGIKEAQGEYIVFLDSDDFLHKDTLRDTDKFIRINNNDVVLLKMVGHNGRSAPKSMFKKTESNISLINSRIIYTLSPTKVFKRSFLINNNIYFPEDLKSAEDQIFTMKAYLNAENIGVLCDKGYYYLTLREGEHMSNAYVSPDNFYKVMTLIVESILESKYSEFEKNQILMIFINRHFNFSRTKFFSLKISDEQSNEWMKALSDFVNKIPSNIDDLVEGKLKPLLYFARRNDFDNYKLVEQSYKNNRYYDIRINENDRLDIKFSESTPVFRGIDINKPKLKMTNFQFDNTGFILEVSVVSSMINLSNNNTKLKLVSRNKKHSIDLPVIYNSSSQFSFSGRFNMLSNYLPNERIWDVFVELTIGDKTITIRIGNDRTKFLYKKEDSTIIDNNNNYCIFTPYFTKDYDNLSFYIKEYKIKELLDFKYHNRESIHLKYLKKNLIFENSFVKVNLRNKSLLGYLNNNLCEIELFDKGIKKRELKKIKSIDLLNSRYIF